MSSLIQRDLQHVWHPCSQMKDFETYPPFEVTHAEGSFLYTSEGKLIDALSSWWCKPLGHRHPAVIAAIQQQLARFEHVMGAHATHEPLVCLTEKLSALSELPHALFASDGACSVEMAIKLTMHARQIKGEAHKTQFLSLKHGYHGETLGALSVSDMGIYKAPYQHHCFPCHHIEVPYTAGLSDPLSQNASQQWETILPQLEALKLNLNACIFEPLIQGSNGMQPYSVDFLNRLMRWAKQNDIYCIADEIMTGLCRTGHWFATDYAAEKPDIMCLSKGLTGGSLPLSMTLVSKSLFDLFYQNFDKQCNFLHSHTHSGNALAVAAALATIQVLESENFNAQAHALQTQMRDAFEWLHMKTGLLSNIRGIGGIIAADLPRLKERRISLEMYKAGLKHGVLLRPIGQTLYWLPPLNLTDELVKKLTESTYFSLLDVYNSTIQNASL